jgi:ABC-type antimicrobial peptide transport system permease subunit
VRRELRSVDPAMPLTDISTMEERVAKVTSRYRYGALLMGMFATLALVISAVGVYGVTAYGISARTREFGVRIALGARPNDILRLVFAKAAAMLLAGLLVGLVGAFAATRVLASLLYDLRPTDPLTFLVITALLAVVVLAACYLPARQATRVEPTEALRYE